MPTLFELRACLAAAFLATSTLLAADWPQWGRTPERNMVGPDTPLPLDFVPGQRLPNSEEIDLATTRHVRWVAKLGSQAYGNPTVAGGKVFVGTNNASPRNPARPGDRSNVYCFDEQSGAFLWQLSVPKLGAGKVSDWEFLGICSSPAVEGNRVYLVTNRCEVVCLDTEGLANGNDGPFTGEAAWMAEEGKPPLELAPTDGDIVWRYDMREELGVFPHNISSSSVLIVGDRLYVTTSNGQDWSHVNIPNPRAPTLIVLDRHTGQLLAEEASGISTRLFHCNWSSPALATIDGRQIVIFGAGDGFLYGFDPQPVKDADGLGILKELFRVDCNPPEHKADAAGKPFKYPHPNGHSEIIATPVVHDGLVYVAVGQDPEHGTGVGALSCIRLAGASGDASQSALVWRDTKIERSISTVAVKDGLVYAADFTGYLRCYDAATGAIHWTHDTLSNIWSSPLVVGDRVYLGNEDGLLTILQTGRELKVLASIQFEAPIYAAPIVANGTLYVGTQTHLYAISPTR